ncbi:Disulfide-bond oxidoreductase YfcG [Zhongshania aliphaticivorans]|uniref:Disulfide-bond oxidoreductase YfcG n=1 Tax=Zhongshania aliphaticivorans TaxID=1470434 RepID=A0A5S9P324_9GAMM|nr:glutathione S-transferase N-terminal domain-containing protein [Zhongshania aliphaticivorans]CAA0090325.1 Disulfide-bond oxidoreductase YfcG [Zhongshania aliphaticivorans]CAA0097746.1 Disulfide-bond oxidoreductase YfcG [Zhongshania aliphaticivorans]
MIDLHTVPTPNGHKISIALEELGLDYQVIPYDISAGDQFKPELLALNPNNKLPVIVDHASLSDDGTPMVIFETGAILIYLAEKTGKLLSDKPDIRFQQLQWLMFQVAGIGPLQGQAHHFVRYARVQQDYARERYLNESLRQCRVLEGQLQDRNYLAGDYSIADIACWPWIRCLPLIDIHLENTFPRLFDWFTRIEQRPAVERGKNLIHGWVYQLPPNFKMELDEKTWSYSFGEEQFKPR